MIRMGCSTALGEALQSAGILRVASTTLTLTGSANLWFYLCGKDVGFPNGSYPTNHTMSALVDYESSDEEDKGQNADTLNVEVGHHCTVNSVVRFQLLTG